VVTWTDLARVRSLAHRSLLLHPAAVRCTSVTKLTTWFARFLRVSIKNLSWRVHLYVLPLYGVPHLYIGGVVSLVAGGGTSGYQDGAGSSALFSQPAGIAVDTSGNLFLGDFLNYAIRKIDSSSIVTTFAGSGGLPGLVDGFGTAARFGGIYGVCMDTYGRLFVADNGNHVIRVVESSGERTVRLLC
jgi:hypothetical protein